MTGERGPAAVKAGAFADALRSFLDVPVELQDERLSTVEAERALREAGVGGRERRDGGRSIRGDRDPASLARRAPLTRARSVMRRAGYPPNPWSRDSLAGRTGMTIRTAGRTAERSWRSSSRSWCSSAAWSRRARYYGHCKGASGPKDDVAFTVAPGTSGEEVVSKLHDLGVVRCGGIVGRILLRGTGKADAIRAGSYTLTTNMTLDDAIEVLSTPPPPVPTVRLTIPEGYRLTQIAERVHEELGIPQDRFLTSAQGKDWSLAPYLPAGKGTEGFLFPETYRFAKDATSNDVIQRLLDQFDSEARGSTGGTRRRSASPTTRSS